MLINYKWKKNSKRTKLGGYRGSNMRQNEFSVNVGYIRRMYVKGQPIEKGVNMKFNNEEIFNECKRLFPDFEFNGLMINKNFKCPPHKDKKNSRESLIIGLGNYDGGELVVENEPHDIRYKPMIFNASVKEHYVNEWSNGDRYSIVLFSL